jgi:hypothetical protein
MPNGTETEYPSGIRSRRRWRLVRSTDLRARSRHPLDLVRELPDLGLVVFILLPGQQFEALLLKRGRGRRPPR